VSRTRHGRPATASTMSRVAVAMPARRWSRLRDVRSAASSEPARPATAASSSAPTATGATAATTASGVPLSEPAEYDIARISRDAGEAIFARIGVGDPYRTGLPYPIFLALLRAFPKTFGATTGELAAKFGFIARAPDPASKDLDVREGLPVGMHLTIDPFTNVPFVVTSCALCHAEQVDGHVVVGLGNKRARVHAYDRAFAQITADPKLTADHLVRLAAEAADAHHVTWPAAYAEPFTAAVITALQRRAADRHDLHARTAADPPGRVATIESFAMVIQQLSGHTIQAAPDVGWVKIPDVIGFGARTTLSWDGSAEGPMDLLAVEAEVVSGVLVDWLERHPFQGASLGAYLRQPAPRPPYPGKIDRARAERGRRSFEDNCAHCHGHYAADGRVRDYDEQIVPLEDLKTDPARMLAPTATFEAAANDRALTRGYTRFRRSAGYVPPVLTNVWARGPYGHAGQWPNLATIATPPARRATRVIYALGAPYDVSAIGVATRAPGATGAPLAAGDYVEDGSAPGLSVLGHPFLADLGPDEAAAVIEYLKTL
jgi:hypothetical protein